ncbi:MAG: hypothetical protein E6P95_02385 [Candidatus Moraniibacteriota bacterium]|jgi:hypothetical protein|nr:MAG: hypothetical protein E6P95_02385 [Candidatus Moranbacteria bacterium]
MKKHDIVSILITFLVGVFIGGYFYLTNFAGLVAKIETPDIETVSEFTIVADVYGGCRNACPSFQVQNDGTYRYLYTPAVGAEQVLRKGALSRELLKSLQTVVTKEALATQSKVITPALCNSFTDGIDIRYEITLDGVVYRLDSCGTAVVAESKLWATLSAIWDFYETEGNN